MTKDVSYRITYFVTMSPPPVLPSPSPLPSPADPTLLVGSDFHTRILEGPRSYDELNQVLEETAPLLLLETGEEVVGGPHVEAAFVSARSPVRTYSTPLVQFLLALSGFAPPFFVNVWRRFFPRSLWRAVQNVLGHDWKVIIRSWWGSDESSSALPEWGRWDDERLTFIQRYSCFNRLVVLKVHSQCLTAEMQENILKWSFGERDVEGFAVMQQFQRWIQNRNWDSHESDIHACLAGLERTPMPC